MHRVNANEEDFGTKQAVIQTDNAGALRISLCVAMEALASNSAVDSTDQ